MSNRRVSNRRVLVAGANGQLGYELQRTVPEEAEIIALDHNQLDIAELSQVNNAFVEHQPAVVINAAAYTAVDRAESEQDEARRVNARGAENLAAACHQSVAKLIHISTDFVFDGSNSRPYTPEYVPNPLGIYGGSKLAGEFSVRNMLAGHGVIVRTGWVYSSQGNNFVKTMLRLMSEKDQLGVVADQVGTPTWAKGLAECCCIG